MHGVCSVFFTSCLLKVWSFCLIENLVQTKISFFFMKNSFSVGECDNSRQLLTMSSRFLAFVARNAQCQTFFLKLFKIESCFMQIICIRSFCTSKLSVQLWPHFRPNSCARDEFRQENYWVTFRNGKNDFSTCTCRYSDVVRATFEVSNISTKCLKTICSFLVVSHKQHLIRTFSSQKLIFTIIPTLLF